MGVPAEGWRTSSYTANYPPDCIAVSENNPGNTIAIRDSKDPNGPRLEFGREELRAFFTRITTGTIGHHND